MTKSLTEDEILRRATKGKRLLHQRTIKKVGETKFTVKKIFNGNPPLESSNQLSVLKS